MTRAQGFSSKAIVTAITADSAFAESLQAINTSAGPVDIRIVSESICTISELDTGGVAAVIVDLDSTSIEEMQVFEGMMRHAAELPPVIVVSSSFDADVARRLLQMRVADFLVKPVEAAELVKACIRVSRSSSEKAAEAQIYGFIPAVGGAGVTTLAIQTALLLLRSGQRRQPRTCLVDLDFQHGACADYLDLEPRLDLKEIEPRPERLDRQLLEIMLSHHATGLEVVAAPNRPAEMRTFDPDMVTRLLDLVSAHFEYVVIDMPRTWFSWTDSVLLGTNKLFIVSEMTVPSLRHAKGLVGAIRERLADGPHPKVIVNRFEQRMFDPGLKKADLVQALGDDMAGTIPNNYRLVREAIDRGIPLDEVSAGNSITTQLKKLILPQLEANSETAASGLLSRLSLSFAK